MVQSDHWEPALRRHRGMLDAAAKVWAERGLGGFYRGFSACLLRAFPASAATFATYNVAARYLN